MGMYPGGNIIRVTPTLSTDAYAQGDVLFNSVEVPNAVSSRGGVSKLTAMFVYTENTTDTDIDFIFTQDSVTFGTINATANVNKDTLKAANIIGHLHQDSSVGTTGHIDNAEIKRVLDTGTGDGGSGIATPILLQAAEGSKSVYISGIQVDGSTNTYAADDIQLILHVKYLG